MLGLTDGPHAATRHLAANFVRARSGDDFFVHCRRCVHMRRRADLFLWNRRSDFKDGLADLKLLPETQRCRAGQTDSVQKSAVRAAEVLDEKLAAFKGHV